MGYCNDRFDWVTYLAEEQQEEEVVVETAVITAVQKASNASTRTHKASQV
jgi:hypothetical protein